MLSLTVLFWLMVLLFALSGSLRGWSKEVVAASGLILSLFAINQFGFLMINLFGWTVEALGESLAYKRQFYLFAGIHLLITFFSYQGPRLSSGLGQRLRPRDNLQDKLLGAIVGAINGYLVVGALWSFLEYHTIGSGSWVQLPPGVPYPFDPTVIIRPTLDSAAAGIIAHLPIPFLSPYLPYIMVIVFLFLIIVMI